MAELVYLTLLLIVVSHVGCSPFLDSVVRIGDIYVPKNRSGMMELFKWPNGEIPFRFADDYPEEFRDPVRKAVEVFSDITCMKVYEADNPTGDHVIVRDNAGCTSMVGRCKDCIGFQSLSLSQECIYDAAIQHEFMHAAGLQHEQSRPDRDDYITINWDNLKDRRDATFSKTDRVVKEQNRPSPYDYYSVMHYEYYYGAKDFMVPVMSAKDPKYRNIGTRNIITELDKQKLQSMYPC